MVMIFGAMWTASDMVRYFIKVCDSSQTIFISVIGKAHIKEATIFLRVKLMHVATAWSHQQQIVLVELFLSTFLRIDYCIGSQKLLILIIGEVIVLVLGVLLIKRAVAKLSKHELEVHTHVGVVVQWHLLSLLDEEEYKSVIVIGFDVHFCQWAFEVIRIVSLVGTLDSKFLQGNPLHTFDDILTSLIFQAVVQKVSFVLLIFHFDTHVLHLVD